MSKQYNRITIDQIPDNINFEGYYWYSNAKTPETIHKATIDKSWFTDLPFVIEANFYAREEQVSIQIKNIDGQYHVARIDLNENNLKNAQKYAGHDIEGLNYQMVEAWENVEEDVNELKMNVLRPTWTAFAGFIKKSK